MMSFVRSEYVIYLLTQYYVILCHLLVLMTTYDWKSNITVNIKTLRLVGLWPSGEDTYKPGLYMIHAAFFLSVFLISDIFFQAVQIYFVRTNLEAVTAIFYVVLVKFMVALKSYHLIRNMSMLKKLLRILNTDMFQPKNEVQMEAIAGNIWFWRLLYRTFMVSCIMPNIFWAIYPLLDRVDPNDKRLPFLAWYPFDTTVSPFYEIIYLYQVFSVGYITTIHVNVDSLVAALNAFNGSQFDILCDNLRNLHRIGENISTNFVNCVKHHKEILSYSDKSNKFLNWILFVQFFVSGVSIGMTMFQLTLVVPMSNQFYSLLSYVIAITIQIFMYCWFGNEVEVKSNNIPYASFECDWTDFSNELKKDLLFFTVRAQTPVKLSALNLFYLSLDTFMKIMKTSWSYFALLHQVTIKE